MKSPSKIALLGAVSVFALSACSATQDKAMPGTSEQVNVTYEYKRDRVQEQINNIPDWIFSGQARGLVSTLTSLYTQTTD